MPRRVEREIENPENARIIAETVSAAYKLYERNLGSFGRGEEGAKLSYHDLEEIVVYLKELHRRLTDALNSDPSLAGEFNKTADGLQELIGLFSKIKASRASVRYVEGEGLRIDPELKKPLQS